MLTRRQCIIWTNGGLIYWHIYASLDLNELKNQAWDGLIAKASLMGQSGSYMVIKYRAVKPGYDS